jgi:hypothetical protein
MAVSTRPSAAVVLGFCQVLGIIQHREWCSMLCHRLGVSCIWVHTIAMVHRTQSNITCAAGTFRTSFGCRLTGPEQLHALGAIMKTGKSSRTAAPMQLA